MVNQEPGIETGACAGNGWYDDGGAGGRSDPSGGTTRSSRQEPVSGAETGALGEGVTTGLAGEA